MQREPYRMSHSHGHHQHQNDHETKRDADDQRDQVLRRLQMATLLCVVFMAVEVVGGLLAQSLAILSDAAHLFADLAAFAVAIGAHYVARWPGSPQHTYGLQRAESLAALFSMLSLAGVCVWLAVEAVVRLMTMMVRGMNEYDVDGKLMSVIAGIGVAVNLALAYVLGEHHVHMPGSSSSAHDHDHQDHAHDGGHSLHTSDDSAPTEFDPLVQNNFANYCRTVGCNSLLHPNEVPPPIAPDSNQKKGKRNVNLQAAYLHVLGDLAQSAAVLVAGLVIWWQPHWAWIDPVCTLGFCVLVFYSTLSVVRNSIAILLEETPPHISWRDVFDDIRAVPGVTDVHDLHIWCISDGVPILSVHFAVSDDASVAVALHAVHEVCKKHGILHATLQAQPASTTPCVTCGDRKPCCDYTL